MAIDYTSLEDAELIDLAKRADHAAYRVLVERYKDAGYGLALRLLRNPSDAEDALQEAFTKAYVYLESYSASFRFYTWFSTIVRNVALSHLRARDWVVSPSSAEIAEPERAPVEDSPELATLAASRADMVREAVAELPERYRRVVILRYWHELSCEEIAKLTEQSLSAVKTQLHRARLLLGDGLRLADSLAASE